MEILDKLTNAGVSLYDLNNEYLNRTDWDKTLVGARAEWSEPLQCFVNMLATWPHPAAIFWDGDLTVIHNLAWGKAAKHDDGQGKPGSDWYQGESLKALESAKKGRTVKVAGKYFFESMPKHAPGTPVVVSPMYDSKGKYIGVVAQLLYDATIKHGLDDILYRDDPRPNSSDDKEGEALSPGSRQDQHNQFLDKTEQDQEAVLNKIRREKDKEGKEKPQNVSSASRAVAEHGNVDLKQSQLFQRFAELLPTGLAILNAEAEAVFVNDEFFELTTKKSSREFRSWPESIDPRDHDRVMGQYRDAFQQRSELRVEFRTVIEEAQETEPWRMFLLRPLSQDTTSGYICAVVDIGEIKNAEMAQQKAAEEAKDRKEQQERFIDMVSHEIRNPLSAVLHLAEEIKELVNDMKGRPKSEHIAEIVDAADTILLCVSHQSRLVDDILSFSKLDSMMLSLAPSVVQPKWDFSKQLKVFKAEMKTKEIAFEYALDVSYEDNFVNWVVADLTRIKQVMVNLLTNAIKFTAKKHGERKIGVAVGASSEKPTSYPPSVVFFETNDRAYSMDQTMTSDWGRGETLYLMVAVKDTGIGISEDDQVKLFERFRQATPKTSEKYGGSGLGLSIARKLCQLHGGDIGVSSKEGEGSTFGFYFKVRRADEPDEDDLTPAASGRSTPALNRQDSYGMSKSPVRPRLQSRYSHNSSNAQKNAENEGIQMEGDEERAYKGRKPERPPLARVKKEETRSSSHGSSNHVSNDPYDSLDNPPVQLRGEAHPRSSADSRYKETKGASDGVQEGTDTATEELTQQLPERLRSGQGETNGQRQASDKYENEAPKSRPTLLLVEDNMINQKVLKRQLQSHGFQVYTANNGQEAVDAVTKRSPLGSDIEPKQNDSSINDTHLSGTPTHHAHNPSKPFDVILMDQEMPIKDGNAAAREIKDFQKESNVEWTPILGVSANVREEQKRGMFDAGMDDVISKPFKVAQLVKRIEGLMNKEKQGQGKRERDEKAKADAKPKD